MIINKIDFRMDAPRPWINNIIFQNIFNLLFMFFLSLFLYWTISGSTVLCTIPSSSRSAAWKCTLVCVAESTLQYGLSVHSEILALIPLCNMGSQSTLQYGLSAHSAISALILIRFVFIFLASEIHLRCVDRRFNSESVLWRSNLLRATWDVLHRC